MKQGWTIVRRAVLIPRTAVGWKQALIAMLPMYSILLIVVVTRLAIQTTPLSEIALLFGLLKASGIFLVLYAFWMPVFCALMFRLRYDRHQRNVLLAFAIYFPILSIATFIALALESTDFLTSDISIPGLRVWIFFALFWGLIGCLAGCVSVFIPNHNRDQIFLPSNVVDHPFYLPAEVIVAIASLLSIVALLVLGVAE